MGLRPGRGIREALSAARPRSFVLAAVTGALTGASVAAFEWLTRDQLFDRILAAPLAVQVGAPLIGLAGALVLLRWAARGATPSTSDEYIANFHQPNRLDLTPVLGRIAAGVATLGSGGAMGYEGPSLYLGAAVGSGLQRRWARWFTQQDAKLLMVAGAAAGVAAIFEAPATGAIFALEVPYRDDNARRFLLPALLAAAVGYLVFVTLVGTQPLFSVTGSPQFDLKELGGAAVLGILCGVGARGFAIVVRRSKQLSTLGHPAVRVGLAGATLAALAAGSQLIFDSPLTLGPGYQAVEWVAVPGHALTLVVTLFAFRLVATAATIAGGGVGGLFIPLVVAGAILGSAVSGTVHDTSNLFPLIGVAAFLGAGYRTPLAGVMFVAETTGRPGFVVPGLIASVAAQLVMGDVSVSPYQRAGRTGHLEGRLALPVSSVVNRDVITVRPDDSLDQAYERLAGAGRFDCAVVDDGRYLGMASVDGLRGVAIDRWPERSVASIVVDTWPTVPMSSTVEDAVRAMEAGEVDILPVLDGDELRGIVTTTELVGFAQVLDELESG